MGGEGGDDVAVGLGGLVVGCFDLGRVSLYGCGSVRDGERKGLMSLEKGSLKKGEGEWGAHLNGLPICAA